jgi:probable HAF family extracellular repeat protein
MKSLSFKFLIPSFALLFNLNVYAYEYSLFDLGTLADHSSDTVNVMLGALNDTGMVSATIVNNTSTGLERHAVVWNNEVKQLGSLGGSSFASGINNIGEVVGSSYLSDNFTSHAFLWSNNTVKDLGTLGGDFSRATDINDNSEIVGSAYLKGNKTSHAALWKDNNIIDLESLYSQYSSYATSINNIGGVVGYSENFTKTNATHATYWNEGLAIDLGTLGGNYSYAFSINDNNQIVGISLLAGSYHPHATLWHNGSIFDLGTIGTSSSRAFDINNDGLIVGSYNLDKNSNDTAAALWRNGQIIDINTLITPDSGWFLSEAAYINNAGQILGSGSYNGEKRFYLLSPIPEPQTSAMVLVGFVLMGFISGRKKV